MAMSVYDMSFADLVAEDMNVMGAGMGDTVGEDDTGEFVGDTVTGEAVGKCVGVSVGEAVGGTAVNTYRSQLVPFL